MEDVNGSSHGMSQRIVEQQEQQGPPVEAGKLINWPELGTPEDKNNKA